MTVRDAERDPLEALVEEFMERQRRGERPSVSEYAAKYPQWADEIRELFPTIAAVEHLKVHKEQSGSGRASLGPLKIERLGDFRIIREIGRGGMGIVFEAEQESLGRADCLSFVFKRIPSVPDAVYHHAPHSDASQMQGTLTRGPSLRKLRRVKTRLWGQVRLGFLRVRRHHTYLPQDLTGS